MLWSSLDIQYSFWYVFNLKYTPNPWNLQVWSVHQVWICVVSWENILCCPLVHMPNNQWPLCYHKHDKGCIFIPYYGLFYVIYKLAPFGTTWWDLATWQQYRTVHIHKYSSVCTFSSLLSVSRTNTKLLAIYFKRRPNDIMTNLRNGNSTFVIIYM